MEENNILSYAQKYIERRWKYPEKGNKKKERVGSKRSKEIDTINNNKNSENKQKRNCMRKLQGRKNFFGQNWILFLAVLIFMGILFGGKYMKIYWENIETEKVEKEKTEKNSIEQDRVEQKSIEQEKVKQKSIEQDRMEQKSLEQEKVEQKGIEQKKVEQKKVEQKSIEQDRMEQEKENQRLAEGEELRKTVAELFLKRKAEEDEGNVLDFGEDIYWMDIGNKAHPFSGRYPRSWKAGGRIISMVVNENGELLELIYEGEDKSRELWKLYEEDEKLVVDVVEE